MTSYSLRDETEADMPFLRDLYRAVRWEEAARMGLADPAQRAAFLDLQFDMQRTQYRAHYPDAQFGVIEIDGAPVGRLYVWRGERAHRIVDISLLPELSGQGVGGRIIDALQAEAAATGSVLTLHVDPSNPARRLYARKGFVEAAPDGPYLRMEWAARG